MKPINFNPELFNPNFWHLHEHMRDPNIRFIWMYGGSSSSKTYSGVQAILYTTLRDKCDSLVFRKTKNAIENSIFKDFTTIIENDWIDISHAFKITRNPLRIRCMNGAVIDFGGMDDPEKIKGISQYKYIYNNEISAFDEADLDQVRKRLRGQPGQQIISDFNPIDETHWIKENIFDKTHQIEMPVTLDNGIVDPLYTEVTEKWRNTETTIIDPKTGKEIIIPPNMIVIRSTYLNNYWAVGSPCAKFGFYDTQLIADFQKDKENDENFYNVYALGLWGKYSVGGEFYKKFSRKQNVVPQMEAKYNPDLPLHISFDENVNPYLSLGIYQATGNKALKIDEICLRSPKNTLKDTLAEFVKRYPPNKSGLYIYGDRTSKKEDSKLEKGTNFFTIIQNTLHRYNPTLRLPTKNPPVVMRGNFFNDEILPKQMLLISDKCKHTIADFEYLKEAADGTKAKIKDKDPITKVTFQKYGHLSDETDYFICEYFKPEFVDYQRGKGRKPVMNRTTKGKGGRFKKF